MNDENVRKFENEQALIKQSYKAMEGPGMDHLLAWLETNRVSAMKSAETEVDNAHKRSVYLQDAIVYHKVKLHLASMSGE